MLNINFFKLDNFDDPPSSLYVFRQIVHPYMILYVLIILLSPIAYFFFKPVHYRKKTNLIIKLGVVAIQNFSHNLGSELELNIFMYIHTYILDYFSWLIALMNSVWLRWALRLFISLVLGSSSPIEPNYISMSIFVTKILVSED